MAEGGHKEKLDRSMQCIAKGSQDCVDYYCESTHVKDIKVEGHISSSAYIAPHQLLISDFNNNKVRLVDTGSGRQVSELKLPGQPWQVTRISDTEAAVSLPYNRKVIILRIKQTRFLLFRKPQLSVIKEISVQGLCWGIAHMDSRLIVAFSDGHIDILDMSGKVLRTISAERPGRNILTGPLTYVTVGPDTGSMYVSDWDRGRETGNLVKLSNDGNVLATYRSDGRGTPNQVTIDSQGLVYVTWAEGCVEQLSANCDKVRTIIPYVSCPRALSYDEATQQFYVGQRNGVVRVYRLS